MDQEPDSCSAAEPEESGPRLETGPEESARRQEAVLEIFF